MAIALDKKDQLYLGDKFYSSPFHEFGFSSTRRVLILRRTDVRYEKLIDLLAENVRLHAQWEKLESKRLVFDVRAARLNDKPSFEEGSRQLRANIGYYFERVAVLVATTTAGMQCSRWFHGVPANVLVTRDVHEALTFTAHDELRPDHLSTTPSEPSEHTRRDRRRS